MYMDMPLEELKEYLPKRTEPQDDDSFWQQTLEETHSYFLNDCGSRGY